MFSLFKTEEKGERDCRDCPHLVKETESWEMSHIWWYDCNIHLTYSCLKSFPFKNTKCKDHPKWSEEAHG